jgi:hypothetical protein
MEEIGSVTVIKGDKYYSEKINSCYEEFLRLKPEPDSGEIYYSLLRDAVTSLIKYLAKGSDNSVLSDNIVQIVALTEKYVRIYFKMGEDERYLLMLRSALYDIVRGYDYTNAKYDSLIRNMYESIRKLIIV